MPTCIYCLGEKEPSDFTRDHILPEAYGTFANNLPKLRCVCHACNQQFGNSLELGLGRDSFEAYLRLHYHVKDPTRVRELGSKRITFTYAGPGNWRGVLLRLVLEGSGLVVDLVSQVAFKENASGQWKHFTEQDIDCGNLDRRTLDLSNVKLFARDSDTESRLFKKLAEHGISFETRKRLDSPDLFAGGLGPVDVHFKVDRGVRRCVAKIAFNYLAFAAGPEFVLGPDFDEVRRFVVQGESPGYRVVEEDDRPILADDRPEVRQTNGHLVALDWEGSDLVCRVSLFNHLTYRVRLARLFNGIWRPMRCGHLFDFQAHRVVPLVGVSNLLIPFRPAPVPLIVRSR